MSGRLRTALRGLLAAVLLTLAAACGTGAPLATPPPGCEAVFAATSLGIGSVPLVVPHQETVVTRVVDGDTVVIAGGQRVRYIGIDTPEMGPTPEHYAREATERNRRLVEGQRVRLEREVSETDRFGRLLRYVRVDGLLVNAELVRQGYARARPYPPDDRYAPCLKALEEEARRHGRGMWHPKNSD